MRIQTRPGDIETDKRIAERCAARIAEYWSRRGRNAVVWIETISVGHTRTYGVRSDLVNGTPQLE